MIDKDIEILQENMIKLLSQKNQNPKQLEFDFYPKETNQKKKLNLGLLVKPAKSFTPTLNALLILNVGRVKIFKEKLCHLKID